MIFFFTELLRVINRRSLLALLTTSILITIMEVISVSAVVPAIGIIIGNRIPASLLGLLRFVGVQSPGMQKMAMLAAISAVFLGRGVLLSVITFVQSRIVFNVQQRLSNALFRRYLSAEFARVNDIASAHLLRVSTAELANITHGIVLPAATLASELAMISGAIIVLLVLQPLVALPLLLIAVGLSLPIFRLNRTRLTRMGKSRHQMEGERFQLAQEMVAGAREIKVYGLEQQLISAIEFTNHTYARVMARIAFLQAFPRLYLETMGMCILLLICAFLLLRGSSTAETLTFMMILGLATFRALPSLAKILAQLQSLRFYRPSLAAFLQLLEKLPASTESLPAESAGARVSGAEVHERSIAITLSNASYRYESAGSTVFSNLDLSVRTGEMVGIVGVSGVGKSTLLDCLIGLRPLTSGSLTVQDLRTGAIVRPRMSYVPQAPVILNASVWRNITLAPNEVADGSADDCRLAEALELSGFADLMQSRQLLLSSEIVEGGRNMSGGQRQRLALARALYRKADVLVLDESTSALDKNAETRIIEGIKARRSNQIILIVTHRADLLAHCGRIINIAPDTINVTMSSTSG